MKKTNIRTEYDIDGLSKYSKKRLLLCCVGILSSLALCASAVFIIIKLGSSLPPFLFGTVLLCSSIFVLCRLFNLLSRLKYARVQGNIIEARKDVKQVSTTRVGGINIFGRRKYDTYSKEDIRLDLFIEEDEKTRVIYLSGITEEHVRYYEQGGEVIFIPGSRFPVLTVSNEEKWLCPLCGGFNEAEEKTCVRCKRRIVI